MTDTLETVNHKIQRTGLTGIWKLLIIDNIKNIAQACITKIRDEEAKIIMEELEPMVFQISKKNLGREHT